MVAFADGEPFFMIDPDIKEDSEWLICEHFKHITDVVQHYMNLKSLIITQGVILCEKCYQRILEGRSKEVIDSCLSLSAAGWEEIFSLAIYTANRRLLTVLKNKCM